MDDYGRPERGKSYEYYNILLPLRELYPETTEFDYMARLREAGRRRMNQDLLEFAERSRPDIVLVALYTDQFLPETIRALGQLTTTVAYFFDESWRRSYARFWARHFHFLTTPERAGLARYRDPGLARPIHSPFGFNPRIYEQRALPLAHEVSFVGLWHPYREWFLRELRRAGIRLSVSGHGWPGGRISVAQMVDLFNSSAINLNLPNSTSWEARYLLSTPLALATNLRRRKDVAQVKARHFELAGCGAFQLSFDAPDLDGYFELGRQVVVYSDVRDAIDKIRYFLRHDDERRAIGDAARRRALAEHTAQQRMRSLIESVLSHTRLQ